MWLTLDSRSSSDDLTLAKLRLSCRATSKMLSAETQPNGKSIQRCRLSALPTNMRNIESDGTRRCVGCPDAASAVSATCSGYRSSAHEFRPARCAARTRPRVLGLGFKEEEAGPAVRPVHAVV